MRIPALLAATVLLLAPLALGVASAAPSPVACSARLNVWFAQYSCFVADAGAAGVVVWCPLSQMCAGSDILVCAGPTLFPCTIL